MFCGDFILCGYFFFEIDVFFVEVVVYIGCILVLIFLVLVFFDVGCIMVDFVYYWVIDGEVMLVGEILFVVDVIFGYFFFDLCDWVVEKIDGWIVVFEVVGFDICIICVGVDVVVVFLVVLL